MVVVIFLSIFVWRWAVRTPTPGAEQTASPEQKKPITYAAIGASDVVGVGANDPDHENWTSVLHSYMPEGTRFIRLGRSGITLREANTLEIPEAIATRPDIVTLWCCVNDATSGVSLTSYLEDLKTALTRLTKETQATISLLNLPDLSILARDAAAPEQRALIQGGVQQWNTSIADMATSYGDRVRLIDLYPVSKEVLAHPEYIAPDHFHPSTIGYKRLADLVWNSIQDDFPP